MGGGVALGVRKEVEKVERRRKEREIERAEQEEELGIPCCLTTVEGPSGLCL
jgi:hypothetical protein